MQSTSAIKIMGKNISKELHDDIEMYRAHPRCDDLIFFVYDLNLFIPDQRALREASRCSGSMV